MDILSIVQGTWNTTGWVSAIITFAVLWLTYTIFSIMGFGSAVIAAPVLAMRMPLPMVVPLLSLLDLVAALINTRQLSKNIETKELFLLAPLMASGSSVGIYLLVSATPTRLMLGLGLFVIAYSLYRLLAPAGPYRISRAWVLLFGLIGGLFSGMFGSGGFIFSIYLSHRLSEKDTVRATMTAMTGISTLFRTLVFLAIGTYANPRLLVLAVFGLPAAALGIYCGHHLTLRISTTQFLRILCLMLLATGCSLVWRALHV